MQEIEKRTFAVENAHLKFENYGGLALNHNEQTTSMLEQKTPAELSRQAASLSGAMLVLMQTKDFVEEGFDRIEGLEKQLNGIRNLAKASCAGVVYTPKWHGLGEDARHCSSQDASLVKNYFKRYPRLRLK
jgi:hypothetical protein